MNVSRKRFSALTQEMFGRIPPDLEVPRIPLSRWHILRTIVPEMVYYKQWVRLNRKQLPAFLAKSPARCEALRARIQEARSTLELIGLWRMDSTLTFSRGTDCDASETPELTTVLPV